MRALAAVAAIAVPTICGLESLGSNKNSVTVTTIEAEIRRVDNRMALIASRYSAHVFPRLPLIIQTLVALLGHCGWRWCRRWSRERESCQSPNLGYIDNVAVAKLLMLPIFGGGHLFSLSPPRLK